MAQHYHLILAGGLGTRLAPLSTAEKPKPFLSLIGENTLLQDTTLRLDPSESLWISCQSSHEGLVKSQLEGIKRDPDTVILEPAARNTGPAIAAAALCLPNDAILTVLPADHYIGDEVSFRDTLKQAQYLANDGWIVTLGIQPDYPSSQYGYIQQGERIGTQGYAVSRFTEKPDPETANNYIKQGGYLWNSGMFIFPVTLLLEEMKTHAPDIVDAAQQAVHESSKTSSRIKLDEVGFNQAPNRSVDYAVMEHSDKIAVIPADFDWSDLGTFEAIDNVKVTLS